MKRTSKNTFTFQWLNSIGFSLVCFFVFITTFANATPPNTDDEIASPTTTNTSNILGNAQAFSAYVFEDFTGVRATSIGGLAVGGNLHLTYSSSIGHDPELTNVSLFVEGDAYIDAGNILVNNMVVAGDVSGISDTILLPQGTIIENRPLDYSIQDSKTYYQGLSQSLSQLTANGTYTPQSRGGIFTGDCSSNLQVFTLDAALLASATIFDRLNVECIPDHATILFNISGDNVNLKGLILPYASNYVSRILFNFHEAQTIDVASAYFYGSILAPYADINSRSLIVLGNTIINSVDGVILLGNLSFTGNITFDSDSDRDGDGVVDNEDAFPDDPTETSDRDGDGVGDNSDVFPDDANESSDTDGDGIGDNSDPDIDGDGFTNTLEEQKGTDPFNINDFPDTVKPQLVLNSATPIDIESDFFLVTGITTDTIQPYSGIQQVTIESNRYPNANFIGSYNVTSGAFSIEVPLKALENIITVIATDNSGNETSAELVIHRDPAPTFIDISPENGSVITTDTTTISGTIYSILPVDSLTLSVNDWQLTPSITNETNVYSFSITDVKLNHGINTFNLSIKSPSNKQDNSVLNINYITENADAIPAPTITLISPTNEALLNQDAFRLSALIESSAGPLTITLNGNTLVDRSDGIVQYTLNELLTFNGNESATLATIVATDSLNKVVESEAVFYRDTLAPVIILESPLTPLIDNTINQSPYIMKGTISDNNLTSVLFNNQPVTLAPTSTENTYEFSVTIPIANQETLPISISAYDRSGNNTTLDYFLHNSATASITPLLPAQNTEYINTGTPITVQVVARLNGTLSDETATVQLLSNNVLSAPITMDISGTLASGAITLPADTAEHKIVISLRSQSGEIVTQNEINVQVTTLADVPTEVIRIEPTHNSDYIEPNTPIEIYFNREIDINLLSVQVRETLNGKSYVNEDELGTDFIRSEGYKLVDVYRNLSPVSGQIELNPGGTGVAFYADKMLGYNAQVYVDVTYDGEEISRSIFSVRELPTLINGAVADQFGQPLAGVEVEIPELARKTITNGDGGFAFGYQESGEMIIPSGQYTLLINANFTSPYLGMLKTKISVQKNYGNNLKRFTLQELNRDIAFQNISSGQTNHLVGGDLQLDLTDATVLFNQGRTDGAVHVQFLPFEHIGANLWPSAIPLWLYGIQPKGIQVEGEVTLRLNIPSLSGSYNYLNAESYPYVVLLGYNSQQQVVEPIGVGRVENNQVISEGTVNLTSLDYIGYAQVLPNLAESLESFAQGNLSIQQLKAQLQTVLSQEE